MKYSNVQINHEIKFSNLPINKEDSSKILMTGGPGSFKLNLERIDPISHKIGLKVSYVDQEFTPDFDLAMKSFVNLAATTSNKDMSDLYSLRFATMGKNNLDLDIYYNGLTDISNLNLKNWQSNFVISKFDYSNLLYEGKNNGNFMVRIKEGSPDILEGDIQSSYIPSTGLKEYLKKSFIENADFLAANPPKNVQLEATYKEQLFYSQFLAKYGDSLIPDIGSLGELKSGITFKLNNENNTFLNELIISTINYAIELKGNVNLENATINKGDWNLSVNNYERLVSDLVDYAAKIAQVVKEVSQGQMNINLNDNFKKKIISFLDKMTIKPKSDPNSITIKISLDDDQLMVGEMDAKLALENFMMNFG